MTTRTILWSGLLVMALPAFAQTIAKAMPTHADTGASVVVVYNTRLPDSRRVAEHYAERRRVPANQVIGFDLPTTEAITRVEFVDKLQKPLLKELEARKLFTLGPLTNGLAGRPGEPAQRRVTSSKVRYATLCYGVPLKIARDATLIEEGADKLPVEFRRNEAAVDSQLALLPASEQRIMWAGPVQSPFYGSTNDAVFLQPTNGLLMVARLDGPTADIAYALVDKALEAETNGLWGRAYFDARGITNGGYQIGDEWIRTAARICLQYGLETELDNQPDTLDASYPLSQVALYAGWYDGNASGPFTRPHVEFMPGAIAYHLHSFSATTIRSTTAYWVGPLLARGATATMGCTEEPYLTGTPDLGVFFAHLLFAGSSLGEAAYAASPALSWQTTVVGDPLYRPYGRRPEELHADLEARHHKLVEWSHLRVVDLNVVRGFSLMDVIEYLEKMPVTRQSAVLSEKLADVLIARKEFTDAWVAYEQALKLSTSQQQRVRLFLTLAKWRAQYSTEKEAIGAYKRLLMEVPDYPDPLSIYKKLLPLAQRSNDKAEIERCERAILRLTPPAPPKK